MSVNLPRSLNGYPVIDTLKREWGSGGYMVLVERAEHPVHRYVVAVWHPDMGDSWIWGHYLEEYADALEDMKDRASAARG